MEAAKIIITVKAGVILNKPIEEYSKRFTITSTDIEDKTGLSVMAKYGLAQEYARSLWNPSALNWVITEWIYL